MDDSQREQIQQFFARLTNVSAGTWIRMVAIVLAVIISYNFVTSYGAVVVSYKSIPSGKSVQFYQSDLSNKSLMSIGPLVFVPRSQNSITAVSGESRTVVAVPLPWYGWTSTSIDFDGLTEAEKYAYDSKECMIYDADKDRAVNFACQEPDALYINSETGSGNEQLQALPKSEEVQPFLGGVIGIATGSSGGLFYQPYNDVPVYMKSPGGVSSKDLALAKIVTNHDAGNNHHLIVTMLSGDIYIGKYENDKISYTKIKRPANWDNTMANVCQILAATAYCYQGISSIAPGAGDVSGQTSPGTLLKIDISTPDKIKVTRYQTDNSLGISQLLMGGGKQAFIANNQVYVFKYDGGQVKSQLLTSNVTNGAAGQGEVYFVKDKAVYKLMDDHSASAVYHADKLGVERLFVDNGQVFFSARNSDRGADLSMYKLTAASDAELSALNDVIASYPDKITDVSWMDYIKNKVFIRVKVTFNKQARTAAGLVNQTEYAKVKENVNQQLQQLGVNPSKFEFIFSY